VIIQIILLYASFAFVDILDKFLLTKRKLKPLSYAFFTLITGAVLLVIWPFVYQALPQKFIWLNLFSGAYFGLVIYVYFKTLSYGEVSRVVPVVFGLVPVFDLIFSFFFNHKPLIPHELAALCLLVPGALLMAYYHEKKFFNHFGLKVLAAMLISSYNWFWQYGAQVGSSINNLMWNRLGAAAIMLLVLAVPQARKNIFSVDKVPNQQRTSFIFIIKQAVGGLNFIFLSYFLAIGKVPIIDGLSAFRYVFLSVFALFLSFRYKRVLSETIDRNTIKLKIVSVVLIFFGTLVLFW
jgi:uncharacterized membrane protein